MSKGEKKLKSLGWFGNKYEEAAECFEKAANQFKLAKSCARLRLRARDWVSWCMARACLSWQLWSDSMCGMQQQSKA